MAELTPQDMAAKLLAERFEHSGPVADALSDPIADTPMTVTLDQLQPYDLNPRVTRNPRYDDIKASIRERGLDAPPAITRRPGGTHYIIRNGGNTRLAILRELWSETKDERFFRIPCLFRPWPERGEIIALTGHLAENELHGGLSFIERALGVEKARELYEQESGQTLTQSELARRLSADGYPIAQPHISRMQDAVRYLLPAIPSVLYGGLGRPQVERLTALRRASARIWEARGASKRLAVDFPSLFNDVLAVFDGDTDGFSIKRVQDELIGQMAELLEADYDSLTLEIGETENRQRALTSDPSPHAPQSGNAAAAPVTPQPPRSPDPAPPVPMAQPPAYLAEATTDAGTAGIAPILGNTRQCAAFGRRSRRTPARPYRVAGADHRTLAGDPAPGGRPDRRGAAGLRGERLAGNPGAGRRALSDFRCLVHRAGPGRARPAARAYRAVRARDRRGNRTSGAYRCHRRWHRLPL